MYYYISERRTSPFPNEAGGVFFMLFENEYLRGTLHVFSIYIILRFAEIFTCVQVLHNIFDNKNPVKGSFENK